jgi:two-component system NarL family sensor kinase
LGAELHDGIGQVLSAIALQVSQVKEEVDRKDFNRMEEDMEELNRKLQSAILEVRNISHDLMPEVLESFGLKEAVKQTCNNLQERSGINVTFNHTDLDNRYNQIIEVNLYRVAQELMTNIQRHAECENVFVSLIDHGPSLNLTVEDDGKGFESGSEKEFKGIGLSNVYSRVNLLGGEIDVESDENIGTLVNIEVPKQIE